MPPLRPEASAVIAAPIDVVWSVMTDLDSYGAWNPFCFQIDYAPPVAVGTAIGLHVRWRNGSTTVSPERITELAPPVEGRASMSYVYEGWPARLGLVRGVRRQWLTALDDGRTAYRTVEEFSGPLVRLAGPARVQDGFQRHADALAVRAESLHAQQ